MDQATIHRNTWIEIELDVIGDNIKQLRHYLPPSVRFMAAVKANAYGHGDLHVAQVALQSGADALAVAILEEALHLRKAGIEAPILILTPILPQDVDVAVDQNLSVTVFQASWLQEMKKYKKSKVPLKVHIKFDTGLGRIGIRQKDEWEELLPFLGSQDISVEGVYTHFATANREDYTYYDEQFNRFQEGIKLVKEAGFEDLLFHCANSAAALQFPENALDIVRIGVAMFGIYPSKIIKEKVSLDLKPALSLHSEIVHVKKVERGSFVGYDTIYQTKGDEWIATVPVGYADGWFRCFQGFYVLVDGQKMPIVGTICMDQLMIRLPKRYPSGTKVTLIGKQNGEEITLYDLALHIGSVPQEIPSMITERVPRIYYRHGKMI